MTGSTPAGAEPIEALAARLFACDPEVIADPFPVYARLRAEAPVFRFGPMVVVARFKDNQDVLRRPDLFSAERSLGTRFESRLAALEPEMRRRLRALLDFEGAWVSERDDPDHARLRKLANHAFTPRRIEQMRSQVQVITDRIVDEAEAASADGSIEVVSNIAFRLPYEVIAALLGVSTEDGGHQLRHWSDAIATAVSTEYSNIDAAFEAWVEYAEYVRGLIAERRRDLSGDDLFTSLVSASEDGDALSDNELVSMFVLLLFAGHETTTNLISNAVTQLLKHPDQLTLLREDPSRVRPAVEEFLRFCPSIQAIHRVALDDCDIGGFRVRKGEAIRLLLASGSHDEEMFSDPERFDVTRDSGRHLGFGFGIHTCLGAWLARLETELAVKTLIARYPALRLQRDPVVRPNFVMYGPAEVHVLTR